MTADVNLLSLDGPIAGLVNNELFKTKSTFPVIDPNNESAKPLHDVYGVEPDEAVKAVEAAAAALPTWHSTPFPQRREIFFKAADIIKQRLNEFVAIETRETTSVDFVAAFDADLAIQTLIELGSIVSEALKDEIAPAPNPYMRGYITRIPYGVVLSIATWNGPIILSTRAVANPIIAGNTVVLKTSEYSPLSNSIIGQVLLEAGLPPGVLNIIHTSAGDAPKVTETLIAHPAVRKVNFTGSTRVGSIIGSLCGKYIKPLLLELGGAASLIILDDADLEHAARAAAFGGFLHSGQVCMSTNSVLVHESVGDAFIDELKKQLASIRAGHADGAQHKLRGLFSDSSAKRVQALIADAASKGGEFVLGSADSYQGGSLLQPTVIDRVTPQMDMMHEEIFGPALGIVRFKTDEEAIQIANSNKYGLAGAVHGRNVERAPKVARQIESSLMHVNGVTAQDHPIYPHEGMKNSGYGRFNGYEGIREFLQIKVITVTDIVPEAIPCL